MLDSNRTTTATSGCVNTGIFPILVDECVGYLDESASGNINISSFTINSPLSIN